MRYLTLSVLTCLSTMPIGCQSEPSPDLLLTNGVIYTVDSERSVHGALAIRDGLITFVGATDQANKPAGDTTVVIDLAGKMVLPRLQDTHIHPIMGGLEALSCDLNAGDIANEYVAIIKAYSEANPQLGWITGGGWLMSAFGPGGMPKKGLIDAVVSDRPAIRTSTDGHSGWANSKALALAGITAETPDPVDGRINHNPVTGEPIGSLQEGAMSLVEAVMPELSPEQRLAGLRYRVDMLHAYGITPIQDTIVSEADLATYQALARAISAGFDPSQYHQNHAGRCDGKLHCRDA